MPATDTPAPTAVARFATLPPEHLACQDCGVAVPPPHDPLHAETVTAYGSADAPPLHAYRGMTWDFEMTRCAVCVERRATVRVILEQHPQVRARSGAMVMALHRAGGALGALAAIGVTPPEFDTDRDLARLIDALMVLGLGARWVTQFAPIVASGMTAEACAPEPWAHVDAEQRAAIREAYATYLRRQVEAPRRYSPPAASPAALAAAERSGEVLVSDGCLACGIGSQEAMPSQQNQVWTVATMTPTALGGKAMQGKRIAGYLCMPCARAAEETGAFGPTAWGRAVIAYLNGPRNRALSPELDGVVGWGAFAAKDHRKPNREPWAHLDGLDALKEALK